MPLPLFFEPAIPPPGASFALSEETAKHVTQVLRMRTGEQLALTHGAGNIFTAVVAGQDKRTCTATILSTQNIPKPEKQITIAMSLLKNANRFEWFLEKAVEIGVTEIVPLICARTERQHFRYDRMHAIVVSAMLQSGQAWLPTLYQPIPYNKALGEKMDALRLIAHCAPGDKQTIGAIAHAHNTMILIGPEGDFTEAEINAATSNGFTSVTLGNTRLRTETAGIVAATLLAN